MNTRVTPLKVRFESKFRVTPGCWIWVAAQRSANCNYGVMRLAPGCGGSRFAHRISYELYVGPIPDGMIVCHKCDNPRCVNPDHLFVGTHADNALDREAKGRGNQPRGEASNGVKITEIDVLKIRSDARTQRKIALDYGLSQAAICKIKNKRTWSHI